MRAFAQASHYVGPNDMIRQQKQEARKYGMKWHFYDKIPIVQRQVPKDQFRAGLSLNELKDYNPEV